MCEVAGAGMVLLDCVCFFDVEDASVFHESTRSAEQVSVWRHGFSVADFSPLSLSTVFWTVHSC